MILTPLGGGVGGSVAWGDVTGKPTTFTPATHASAHAEGGGDAIHPLDIGARSILGDYNSGEATLVLGEIHNTGCATGSGTLRLMFFEAQRTETITTLTAWTGGTAASGPTLARYGVYTVDGSGDLTLIHSTANDTSLFGSTNSEHGKALSSSWSKVRGTRYAVGILVVASTAPQMVGQSASALSTILGPRSNRLRRTGAVTSQSDLPSSITAASLVGSSSNIYIEMT